MTMPSIGLGSKITAVLAQAGFGAPGLIRVGDVPIDCLDTNRTHCEEDNRNGVGASRGERIGVNSELTVLSSDHSSSHEYAELPNVGLHPNVEYIKTLDFDSTSLFDSIRATSPEPIAKNENDQDQEEQDPSSQASTSLFTSASDRENEERRKWLEDMKENSEPRSGYTTPRGAKTIDESSQDAVASTPTKHIQFRTRGGTRSGGTTISPSGSPSKCRPLGVAGRRGNKAQTFALPTCGTPIAFSIPTNTNKNPLKRNRSQSEDDTSARPRHKSRVPQSSQDWLPNSQKAKDRAYQQTFGLEARAKAYYIPICDEEDSVYPSSSPE